MVKKLKKTPFEILLSKAKNLLSDVNQLTKEDKTAYDAHYWTAFKLLFLQNFTPTYTRILNKQKEKENSWIENLIYFDPLCNSGINLLEGKDFILGSPLIVIKSAKPPNAFSTIILNDNNKELTDSLDKRIKILSQIDKSAFGWLNDPEKVKISNEDCNYLISEFVLNYPSKTHTLVYLDPLAFEVKWESLLQLFRIKCDIIFLFVTDTIHVRAGKARKGDPVFITKLNDLFGSDNWRNSKEADDLVVIFKKQIEKEGKIVKSYKISGETPKKWQFNYHVLVIVSPTRAGNPWLKNFDNVGDSIEKLNRKEQKQIFDVLKNRQKTLNSFLLPETNDKMDLDEAKSLTDEIIKYFLNYSDQIEIAGSIRRKKPKVKDIELVVSPKLTILQRNLLDQPIKFKSKLDSAIEKLFELNIFTKYVKNGDRYKQIWVKDIIKLDLFIVLPPAQFGMIYLIRTGSANYSKQFMVDLNKVGKFKVENGALYQLSNEGPILIETPTENDVYLAIGKEWIPPEKRK